MYHENYQYINKKHMAICHNIFLGFGKASKTMLIKCLGTHKPVCPKKFAAQAQFSKCRSYAKAGRLEHFDNTTIICHISNNPPFQRKVLAKGIF